MGVNEGEKSGHNSVIVGGYRALAERLAKGLYLQRSMPVSEVRHSSTGVTVMTGNGEATDAVGQW